MKIPDQYGDWMFVQNFERRNVLNAVHILANSVYDAIEARGHKPEDFRLEVILKSSELNVHGNDLSKYSVGIKTKLEEAQENGS